MPAPTALQRAASPLAHDVAQGIPLPPTTTDEDLEFDITTAPQITTISSPNLQVPEDSTMEIDEEGRPRFAPSSSQPPSPSALRIQSRKVLIPPHRMSPLKTSWPKIYPPLVEPLKLQLPLNPKSHA